MGRFSQKISRESRYGNCSQDRPFAQVYNQLTVKGNVDANDLEGLGTQPGYMALSLLLVADLGWVKIAQRRSSWPDLFFSYSMRQLKDLDSLVSKVDWGNFKLHHFGGYQTH